MGETKAADEIVLPRSKLRLVATESLSRSHWFAHPRHSALHRIGGIGRDDNGHRVEWGGDYEVYRGSLKRCIEEMDRRVLELREALAGGTE